MKKTRIEIYSLGYKHSILASKRPNDTVPSGYLKEGENVLIGAKRILEHVTDFTGTEFVQLKLSDFDEVHPVEQVIGVKATRGYLHPCRPFNIDPDGDNYHVTDIYEVMYLSETLARDSEDPLIRYISRHRVAALKKILKNLD